MAAQSPNTPSGVNKIGLPAVSTRRRALASLAGFGAALSFPKVAKATAVLDAPDAVLIAHAAMVEEMASRYHVALTRWVDLTKKAEAACPRGPEKPKCDVTYVKVNRREDGSVLSMELSPIDPAERLADEQHKIAREALKQARADIMESMGVGEAEGLVDDLRDALADVVDDLTSMTATTPASLAAKARAALALDPHHDLFMDEHEQALFVSLAQDVVSIGGAA